MHISKSASLSSLIFAFGLAFSVPVFALENSDSGRPSDSLKHDTQKRDAPKSDAHSDASTAAPHPLPAPSVTSQELQLPGRTLRFQATAGAIRLNDGQSGDPIADLSYVAFELDDADHAKRPLTFAINGGPGASSAWLDLGGLGPWRLPLDGANPSTPPVTIDNAETWLDFTDLVFLDPPGTGYSRMLTGNEEARKHFYSISGDIDGLAVAIRKWITEHKRLDSPKYIVGESYGGFRAPKLAYRLQDGEGIGIKGLVLVSPVLDFSWFEGSNPLILATHLPSMTAAARGLNGVNDRAALADVEAYARGDFIVDLLRGERDLEAQARIVDKVASFTGIDRAVLKRFGGRIEPTIFDRERTRAAGRIASRYDSLATGYDPEPHSPSSGHADDPVLDAYKTPLASTMANITANRLGWPIEARYEILNENVTRQWDWSGRKDAEALGDLKRILALDPHFHVLIVHGLTDEVTPYFTSQLLIDQVAPMGDPNRLRLAVYGGGHMVYAKDQSRAALHDDARKLILGE